MDHYEVLGLTRNASKNEIRDAYKKQALRYHPDKHFKSSQKARDDATRRFTQICEAYNVLIDDQKRDHYHLRPSSSAMSGTNGYASGRYAFNVNPPRYTTHTYRKTPEKTTDSRTPVCKAFGTFNGVQVTSPGVICFGGFVLAGAFAVGSAIFDKLAS